jgi:hypothetical protein
MSKRQRASIFPYTCNCGCNPPKFIENKKARYYHLTVNLKQSLKTCFFIWKSFTVRFYIQELIMATRSSITGGKTPVGDMASKIQRNEIDVNSRKRDFSALENNLSSSLSKGSETKSAIFSREVDSQIDTFADQLDTGVVDNVGKLPFGIINLFIGDNRLKALDVVNKISNDLEKKDEPVIEKCTAIMNDVDIGTEVKSALKSLQGKSALEMEQIIKKAEHDILVLEGQIYCTTYKHQKLVMSSKRKVINALIEFCEKEPEIVAHRRPTLTHSDTQDAFFED